MQAERQDGLLALPLTLPGAVVRPWPAENRLPYKGAGGEPATPDDPCQGWSWTLVSALPAEMQSLRARPSPTNPELEPGSSVMRG